MTSVVAPVQVPPGKSRARTLMLVALGLVPVDVAAWILGLVAMKGHDHGGVSLIAIGAFPLASLAHLVCGVAALGAGIKELRATQGASGRGPAIVGALAAIAALVGLALGLYVFAFAALNQVVSGRVLYGSAEPSHRSRAHAVEIEALAPASGAQANVAG